MILRPSRSRASSASGSRYRRHRASSASSRWNSPRALDRPVKDQSPTVRPVRRPDAREHIRTAGTRRSWTSRYRGSPVDRAPAQGAHRPSDSNGRGEDDMRPSPRAIRPVLPPPVVRPRMRRRRVGTSTAPLPRVQNPSQLESVPVERPMRKSHASRARHTTPICSAATRLRIAA